MAKEKEFFMTQFPIFNFPFQFPVPNFPFPIPPFSFSISRSPFPISHSPFVLLVTSQCSIADVGTNCKTTTSNAKNTSKIQKLNREVKHDVYGKRQTAKITSVFLFFSCNPEINHTNIESVSYYSQQIQIFWFYCTESWRQTAKVSFLPFAVCRKRHA